MTLPTDTPEVKYCEKCGKQLKAIRKENALFNEETGIKGIHYQYRCFNHSVFGIFGRENGSIADDF